MIVTRRGAAVGLGAFGAAAMLPRVGRSATPELEAAARQEGTLTWYIAQVDGETAETMGRAFTAQHPGVKVAVIRTTGQVAYERLTQEIKNSAPQCDVFSATDIAHMPLLMGRRALARYVPENAAAVGPEFRGLGEEGWYYPTTSTPMLIIYNTEKVPAGQEPKAWSDLLDPRWKGRVAFGHPGFSGYVGVWTLAIKKLYGWEWFERLAKNNPRIGRSGNDPVTLLNAGECVVGLGPLATTLLSADKGNPLAVVYPTDGAVLCVGPSAVLAGAPHPNAARLFANWLLSAEFARICVEARVTPARDDVPPKAGSRPLTDVKLLRLTTDEIRQGVPEVIEQWRETFG